MAQSFFIPRVSNQQLATIASRTAGIIAVDLASDARRMASSNNKYQGQINQITAADFSVATSPLGTKVFSDVTFGSVTYVDKSGNTITTNKVTFETILINVTFPKRVVKTEIQGRDGTIKEYIGRDDAQVSFKGVIVGKNGEYPFIEVGWLKDITNAPVPIPVICAYLQNFDIDSVVFDYSSFDQDEGGYSYQAFTLSCISDVPQELKIL